MIAAVTSVLLRQASNIILGLAISILAARSLGPEGNGTFVFLTVLIPPMLLSFAGLGINYSNVFFIARGEISLRHALNLTLRFFIALSILGVILGCLYIRFAPEAETQEWFIYFSIASFVPLLLQTLLASIIQAKQKFRLFSLVTLVPTITMLFLMGVTFRLLDPSPVLGLLCFATAQLIGSIVSLFIVSRMVAREPIKKYESVNFALKYAGHGFYTYLGNLMAFLLQRTNFYFVGIFLGAGPLGIYAISSQMSERLLVLVSSITTVALPRMSQKYGVEDAASATALLSRATLIASSIIAVMVAALAHGLVTILFGDAYEAAIIPLLILLPGTVFTSIARILANDFTARGRPYLNVSTSVFVVIGSALFSVALIPSLGLNGAALASTLSSGVNCIVKLEVYRRQSGRSFLEPLAVSSADLFLYRDAARSAIGSLINKRRK